MTSIFQKLTTATCFAALLTTTAVIAPLPSSCAAEEVHDAAALQAARTQRHLENEKKPHRYYPENAFDLSVLPAYVPDVKVSGTLRVWAVDLWGGKDMRERIAAGFRKYHPDLSIEFESTAPGVVFAGLLTGTADVGVSRRMTWDTLLAFQRRFNHDPLVIDGMTGWNTNPPFEISVNVANPLTQISMEQIDGIFGAARNGGWEGTSWHPEFARGADKNLRRWGQLGLTGEWANAAITPQGYVLRYLFAPRFSDDVMKSGDKWNEALVQHSIYLTTEGKSVSVDQSMADAVGADRYAIAYYAPDRGINANTKAIAVVPTGGGEPIPLTLGTVRDHSYPLFDTMRFFVNRELGRSLDPRIREFLRYILSREGQLEVVRDSRMLPLTEAQLLKERAKLN